MEIKKAGATKLEKLGTYVLRSRKEDPRRITLSPNISPASELNESAAISTPHYLPYYRRELAIFWDIMQYMLQLRR